MQTVLNISRISVLLYAHAVLSGHKHSFDCNHINYCFIQPDFVLSEATYMLKEVVKNAILQGIQKRIYTNVTIAICMNSLN